ncbi:Fe-S-cluster-containing dehydrogenase component [Humidesulfovibrio mexicanus]|uniref:Fe-S-cluster-containing dehydrogenase component n=1 Tax=Humidesulfovibrio mexicanus TaxID=147047 RepID=A0A239CC57_9BACT|nr:4Fe-4S dicluster domain-containing protein [Humidesulfovibrio mexicanus]SNS17826.1 Fe-S-cluster-containing dehydrogenase component [Humidesulfovibrio mexicanus]
MSDHEKILFIDYSRCIGCESCEAACRFVHGQPRINMTRTAGGIMAPVYCRHCESAACVKSCPRGALQRAEDGSVLLNPVLCAGCETKNCILACPFGGIFCPGRMDDAMSKCDLCRTRQAMGMAPACVEICPCGAIHFVTRGEAKALATPEYEAAHRKVMEHVRPVIAPLPRRER